jgi:exodeoxyribonuclease V alpha subunit
MNTAVESTFLEQHLAAFLASRSGLNGVELKAFQSLVEELVAALGEGHSCLPVDHGQMDLLGRSPLVSAGERTPLVLHKSRLYLHRYYTYEKRLAWQCRKLAAGKHPCPDLTGLLQSVFGAEAVEGDSQRRAAEIALHNSLCLISGGPGTGKTSTVVKIIAMLLLNLGRDIHIALCAPTGKAAMRLREAVSASRDTLPVAEDIKDAIPVEAHTLHRLLGVRKNSSRFHHSAAYRLPWDVVVVDEASMVDLALMSKLVDALLPAARLILLGDKDQLVSVESGAVLGDLIAGLPDNTVELQKTYRFDTNIKKLAGLINRGEGEEAWTVLNDPATVNTGILTGSVDTYIGERYGEYMKTVTRMARVGIGGVFAAFRRFQVLCALRRGQLGVEGINSRVEQYLARKGYDCIGRLWYSGRPVLISRNDYGLGLYNGDIGICLPDPGDGAMKVWFESSDGEFRGLMPYRLPQLETVFAMTIHKSQGSECDEVLIVLPREDNRLLSRELIYTGVTRAKKKVRIVAEKEVLIQAISRKIVRHSGLVEYF